MVAFFLLHHHGGFRRDHRTFKLITSWPDITSVTIQHKLNQLQLFFLSTSIDRYSRSYRPSLIYIQIVYKTGVDIPVHKYYTHYINSVFNIFYSSGFRINSDYVLLFLFFVSLYHHYFTPHRIPAYTSVYF